MILNIDTADRKIVEVYLKDGQKVVAKLSQERAYGSQVLLPMIQKILDISKLDFSSLKAIEVNTGPGSFTGIRVGVSVANALGYSLNIPVNGKSQETDLVY